MLQRVQTLWLLLASIAAFLTLKFPFYSGTYLMDNSYHKLVAADNMLLTVLTCCVGVGSLINIFIYKTRKIQLRIAMAMLVIEALVIFIYFKEVEKFAQGGFDITAAFHLLIVIGLIFAARGIYKDQKLIKESNRLR